MKPGGLYIIEDLRWQPEAHERPGIARTAGLMGGFSTRRSFTHSDPEVEATLTALAPDISGCFAFQVRQDQKRRDQVAVIRKR